MDKETSDFLYVFGAFIGAVVVLVLISMLGDFIPLILTRRKSYPTEVTLWQKLRTVAMFISGLSVILYSIIRAIELFKK